MTKFLTRWGLLAALLVYAWLVYQRITYGTLRWWCLLMFVAPLLLADRVDKYGVLGMFCVHRERPTVLTWCRGCDRLVEPSAMRWELDGWYRCGVCLGDDDPDPIDVARAETNKLLEEAQQIYQQALAMQRRERARREIDHVAEKDLYL